MKKTPTKRIPIVFCFNNNYIIPAIITMYSMLEKSNDSHLYVIYILHNDITIKSQKLLRKSLKKYKNYELAFINMSDKLKEGWLRVFYKGHFSIEILYRLVIPSIIHSEKIVIVSDVDVIYMDDISASIDFDMTDKYILGYRPPEKLNPMTLNRKDISTDIKKKLVDGIGAGFMVFNLEKMRKQQIEKRFMTALIKYNNILTQPEQDVLNIVCTNHTGYLPLQYCFCTYMYNLFSDGTSNINIDVRKGHISKIFKTYRKYLTDDKYYSREEYLYAFNNPIQLHYASSKKPWNSLFTVNSFKWYVYLIKSRAILHYISSRPRNITM